MKDEPRVIPFDPTEKIESGGWNCGHSVQVSREVDLRREPIGPGASETRLLCMERQSPVVEMFNDDDSYYHQEFKNWGELEAFIAELRAAGKEAWGSEPMLITSDQTYGFYPRP